MIACISLLLWENYMADQFFDAIVRFIDQTATDDLTTKSYPKTYTDLEVKFSFGQGNSSLVPWIAFTGYSQKVQQGIYPVFLYYKSVNTLILAYGISATGVPSTEWDFGNDTHLTIDQYFKDKKLNNANKYLKSYVFKSYDVVDGVPNHGLNEKEILSDLSNIITQYKNQLSGIQGPIPGTGSIVTQFVADSNQANYRIGEDFAKRFIASLLTKPFVILTGLSGSGKTKLAQVFAKWLCENTSQYRLIPVGADWTNREPLLGYPDALNPSNYVSPDNGALELIIEASKKENKGKPYFLILDEMNMSHVERYFADFLSAMESNEPLPLHAQKSMLNGIPNLVKLPDNLFIIGTVNIDETTYMFSPKVLDRANVIEFRVTAQDMSDYLQSSSNLAINMTLGKGQGYSLEFMNLRNSPRGSNESAQEELMKFFTELKKIGAEFGYRTASEINRFIELMKLLDPSQSEAQILDFAILQKLLPKVHGSRRKLEPVLSKLIHLCLDNPELYDTVVSNTGDVGDITSGIQYPQTLEKIQRMFRGMSDNGFTSFTEV